MKKLLFPLLLVGGLMIVGCQLQQELLIVEASPSDGGTVSRLPDQTQYGCGSRVTLTANPAFGYGFCRWEGDATGTGNPTDITMDGDKTVKAIFAHTYSSGSGGAYWGSGHPIVGWSLTVICTELRRQGLMDETVFEADKAFGRYLEENHNEVLVGYHFWAKPVVKLMRESPLFTRMVNVFARPWSYEMAYRMGARSEGSFAGKIVLFVGVPVCRSIGRAVIWAGRPAASPPNDDRPKQERKQRPSGKEEHRRDGRIHF